MKTLYALLALCIAAPAQAKFPCYPKQANSTGSSYKMGVVDGVRWIAWTCKGYADPFVISAAPGYTIVHPDTTDMTAVKAAEAYIAANVNGPPDPKAAAAAKAAFK